MKVNKILFDAIKAQWDITKITSAYLNAERIMLQQATIQTDEDTQEISFIMDSFGNARQLTPKELIKQKIDAIEEQGRQLLEDEKYELFAELKEIYEKYKQEYDRL